LWIVLCSDLLDSQRILPLPSCRRTVRLPHETETRGQNQVIPRRKKGFADMEGWRFRHGDRECQKRKNVRGGGHLDNRGLCAVHRVVLPPLVHPALYVLLRGGGMRPGTLLRWHHRVSGVR